MGVICPLMLSKWSKYIWVDVVTAQIRKKVRTVRSECMCDINSIDNKCGHCMTFYLDCVFLF